MNLLILQDLVLRLPAAARKWVGCLRRPDGQVVDWQPFGSEHALRNWARNVLYIGEPPADGSLPFHARIQDGRLQAFPIEVADG